MQHAADQALREVGEMDGFDPLMNLATAESALRLHRDDS
jgi:hypothetical protein